MNSFEKLMKGITLKRELDDLQKQFLETLKMETGQEKLDILMDIERKMKNISIEVMRLISQEDEDEENFKIER